MPLGSGRIHTGRRRSIRTEGESLPADPFDQLFDRRIAPAGGRPRPLDPAPAAARKAEAQSRQNNDHRNAPRHTPTPSTRSVLYGNPDEIEKARGLFGSDLVRPAYARRSIGPHGRTLPRLRAGGKPVPIPDQVRDRL